jgi:hypothetical protein
VVHGQAPASPDPHTAHWLSLHVLPVPQSLDWEHSIGDPAFSVGGVQSPDLHTVPCGHSAFAVQLCSQPWDVHTDPLAQSWLLVHETVAGGFTAEHP